MLPNQNLTKEEALWLLNDYPKWFGKRIDRTTIQEHLRAFNLINAASAGVPGCSCQWVSASKVSESLWSQHKSEIEKIANGERIQEN